MNNYFLLTGATGLLGQYLIRDLLEKGERIAVVVRAGKKQSPVERIEAIMQRWEAELGKPLPRPVCLEGNVCEPLLGLRKDQLDWVKNNCNRMLHSAAVLTFHEESSGEPWRTNIEGTKNVLDLCQRSDIREMHYVSTAYVCGNRHDLVREDELDVGQTFRNDYEKSKFEAEKLVRAADFFDCLTVYRPAVIAGDSRTGYTVTYHGLYMYLKLMSILVWNTEPGEDGVRYTPVQLEMTGDEPRNIIPVDWVSEVMVHLLSTPESHGRTFHLAPATPITPRQIIEAGYKYFNSRGVEFIGPHRTSDAPISDMDQQAHQNMTMYSPYETSDPAFDLSNLHQYAGEIPCPIIDTEMLHQFWRYGEQDRWGKRRPPAPNIDFHVEEALAKRVSRPVVKQQTKPAQANGHESLTVGLNVLGPGGGQWRLALRETQISNMLPGLPSHGPILTLRSDILASAFSDTSSQNGKLKSLVADAGNGSLDEATTQIIANSLFS